MKVLLVGGGGREHALAWKLAQSPRLERLIAAPGNPGIARHAECVAITDTAIEPLVALARREQVDLVVVGPEQPLALGLADRLREAGIAVFGPSAGAARIESSKVFAKELMERHAIATARFRAFTRALDARRYAWELGAPLVVKADGLAAGKGAIVCETLDDADRAIALCLEGGFGEAGRAIVVEEFLSGQEVSFFVLSDGSAIRPLAAAQDHKAVFDGDRGPNTGGMGAYSPAPVFDGAMEERVIAEIVRPVIAALSKEGSPYQGVLFVQLMISDAGPRVVEFNCRFGDPECEAIVPRLAGDLLPLLHAVASGRGLPDAPAWRPESSVAVVLASGGYPGSYRTGLPITGIDAAEALDGVTVFQAGTALDGGRLVTAGGRVMAVQALAPDVRGAIDRAYAAAGLISFPGMHYRRDIGRRATCA